MGPFRYKQDGGWERSEDIPATVPCLQRPGARGRFFETTDLWNCSPFLLLAFKKAVLELPLDQPARSLVAERPLTVPARRDRCTVALAQRHERRA